MINSFKKIEYINKYFLKFYDVFYRLFIFPLINYRINSKLKISNPIK